MQVDIHDAKTQFSHLVAAAEAGEDVVIARDGRAVVRLVPVPPQGFRLGSLAHLAATTPDFGETTDDDELALWEGGG